VVGTPLFCRCFENPSQDPSPFHPFPSSLSRGEREEGEGSRGEGLFSWFLGARQRTGMRDCVENPQLVRLFAHYNSAKTLSGGGM